MLVSGEEECETSDMFTRIRKYLGGRKKGQLDKEPRAPGMATRPQESNRLRERSRLVKKLTGKRSTVGTNQYALVV